MARARLLIALAGLLALGVPRAAAAQIVCLPGRGCTIQVQPPPVQWQSPQVQGQTQVQVDPAILAQQRWQLELARQARWQDYFSWRAQVWASAQASIDAQVYIEPLKFQARQTPDPLAWSGAPYGIPGDDYVSFPRLDVGALALCFGLYSGPAAPTYVGYCPAVRYRVTPQWGIAFDPAFVSSKYDERSFGMLGLRPGVQYSFAQGVRDTAASHAYAIAGFDLWIPTSGREATPSAFLGGHVGLGAMLSGGRWGFGLETRALVRGGVGNGGDPVALAMSSLRVGVEVRAPVVYVSFW